MWKQIISAYLSFTKKERRGIAVVLFFVGLFVALPYVFPLFIKPPVNQTGAFETAIAALNVKLADSVDQDDGKEPSGYEKRNWKNYTSKVDREDESVKSELFHFNPNTASEADWRRLGVKEKTISTIQKYISRGGHFYKPEDILKVWGLQNKLGESLVSYVDIPAAAATTYPIKVYEKPTYEKPVYKPTIIDVNVADTTAFIALPGIGSKLSQRIITYRDKLGGFYKLEQVAETFGLADSVFQKIKPRLTISNADIKQLNINTATVDELKVHPYLRFALASAIVQFRVQHGNFSAITDLKKIMVVTDELFNKMAPYLTVH